MYKLLKNGVFNEQVGSIPLDPDNTDYQAFLLWKSQGNEPLPADEVTQG